jgi:hypothetical protein
MLYSTFLAAVNALLGPEAIRQGTAGLRSQHITNALIDLQRYIPSYRIGNSTTFLAANLTVESQAMVGAMPLGAKPKAFYIYSNASGDDPNCKRYMLDRYPWKKRQDLLCGRLDFPTWWSNCCWGFPGGVCPPCPTPPVNPSCPNPWSWCEERGYVYSVSPHLDSFIIYPSLNAYDSLLFIWDGYKSVFNPTDTVPYPIEASEAVAAYVLAKIRRQIDRDVNLARESWSDYLNARRSLIREYNENLVADGEDDEYLANLVAPPGESFISAGATTVPLLQNITAIAGTTANCLAAISTVQLTGPLTVMMIIGAFNQLWTMKQGTDATNVAEGICQANDWATTGNVWYRSNV